MSRRGTRSLWNRLTRRSSISGVTDSLRATCPASVRQRALRHHHLHFEPLEDRRVLATWWVDAPNANPAAGIYDTIQNAVSAFRTHSGDTIKVVAGTYNENVGVNKSLTIIGGQVRVPGATSGPSVITNSAFASFAFFLDANNITVKNFTIRQETVGVKTADTFSGYNITRNTFIANLIDIELNTSLASVAKTTNISANNFSAGTSTTRSIDTASGARNVAIRNNTFSVGGTDAEIEIAGANLSTNVQIVANRFNLCHGITLANVTKAKIDGNQISEPLATPISLAGGVTNSEIAGNTMFGSPALAIDGISVDDSITGAPKTGNKITGNTIDGFDHGIVLDANSEHNTVSSNSVTHSKLDGIRLDGSALNTVSANTIFGSGGAGIYINLALDNTISKNQVSNNTADNIVLDRAVGNAVSGNTANGSADSGIVLIATSAIAAMGNTITGNVTNFNHFVGIAVEQGSDSNKFSGNKANFNNTGFYVSESSSNTFSGNTANGNQTNGFLLVSTASVNSHNNSFSKNIANNNFGSGFGIAGNSNVLTSNTVSGNATEGIVVNGDANQLKFNTASNDGDIGLSISGHINLVSGNTANGNTVAGIGLMFATSSLISGNTTKDNQGFGIGVLDSVSTANTITMNTALDNGLANGGFDLADATTGTAAAGTANDWHNNKANTAIPIGLLTA